MELAEREGNEDAFRPAHDGTLPTPPFRDTLDGRGRGRFVYRVRSMDASGNASAWSAAFPLVQVRDVTPPDTPTVLSVLGGVRQVTIRWRANLDRDLREYRVWRGRNEAALTDVRRAEPLATLPPTSGAVTESWSDTGLAAPRNWYYRLAAVDQQDNMSTPTAVLVGRAVSSAS
jgi:hypothetical protein